MKDKIVNLTITDLELMNIIESLWHYIDTKWLEDLRYNNTNRLQSDSSSVECITNNLQLMDKLLKQYKNGA